MWKQLLVPLDGSPLAEHALPYATALARTLRARLILLHARSTDAPPEQMPIDLEEVARRLCSDGIGGVDTHSWHLPVSGDAGDAILEAATDLNADLIVMATHGRGGIGRMIFGSVADRVIRHTTLPMLLVPSIGDRPWPNDRPTRILVPLDGSKVAEAILAPLQDFVQTTGSDLILLRVAETIEVRLHGNECIRCRMARARGEEPDIEQVRARRYIDDVAARLLARGIMAEARIDFGGPAETISKVAREQDVDLIAMATHGRSGLARLVLGSVATGTLRLADQPMLLVRPPEMRERRP